MKQILLKNYKLKMKVISFLIAQVFIFVNVPFSFCDTCPEERAYSLDMTTLAPNLEIKSIQPVFSVVSYPQLPVLNGERIAINEGESNILDFQSLKISLGKSIGKIKTVYRNNRELILINNSGKHITLRYSVYAGDDIIKIGNAAYVVKDSREVVDIFKVNMLGNVEYLEFFGIDIKDVPLENLNFSLPIDSPDKRTQFDMFPANSKQQPGLMARRVDVSRVEIARVYIINFIENNQDVPVVELLHNIAIYGLNGSEEDYYEAQDVLGNMLKGGLYDEAQRKVIIGLRNHMSLAYVGCPFEKMKKHGQMIRLKGKSKQEAESKRTQSLYELPVERTRLSVKDVKNYSVKSVKALTEQDIEYIPTDANNKAVQLGDRARQKGLIGSIAISGGTATTIKQKIGMHKMVHLCFKVIVKRAGKLFRKWISIIQARVGLLFGQSNKAKVAVVTSVAGTIEGESDRSIRSFLTKNYANQLRNKQMSIVMQRAAIVLNPDTGYAMYFKNGEVATCAENHLWAFLAVLLDKDLMTNYLENTEGVFSVGNGDNILNTLKPGMVGSILENRMKKDRQSALTTIAIGTPSAGDKKGGIMVDVTYRNKVTGQTIVQRENREISEFPTRSKESGFSAIDFSKEQGTDLYANIEKSGLFIEDLFVGKEKRVNGFQVRTAVDKALSETKIERKYIEQQRLALTLSELGLDDSPRRESLAEVISVNRNNHKEIAKKLTELLNHEIKENDVSGAIDRTVSKLAATIPHVAKKAGIELGFPEEQFQNLAKAIVGNVEVNNVMTAKLNVLLAQKVAFNVNFFAVDARLFTARMFGLDENSLSLIDDLKRIDAETWTNTILDFAEKVPMTIKPDKKVPNEDGTDQVEGYITEQAVQDFIVNSLSLLDKKGLPKPVADFQLSPRKDTFLPYKGKLAPRLDRQGNVIESASEVYDLIANQERSAGAVDEFKNQGIDMILGPDEKVVTMIPVDSLDEIIRVNKLAKDGKLFEESVEENDSNFLDLVKEEKDPQAEFETGMRNLNLVSSAI